MASCISSTDNPIFRDWLRAPRNKASWGSCWLPEGLRLCEDAVHSLRAQGEIKRVLRVAYDPERISETTPLLHELKQEGVPIDAFRSDRFRQITDTVSPQGILIAIAPPSAQTWEGKEHSRILILEEIQDPGNLGAIARSADAFGFDAIFLTEGGVSPRNSKALRAGMGAFFHLPVYEWGESLSLLYQLREQGFANLVTSLAAEDWTETDQRHWQQVPRLACWIGNEGRGIRQSTQDAADARIRIPLSGSAESLNAACAATLICYLLQAPSESPSEAYLSKGVSLPCK